MFKKLSARFVLIGLLVLGSIWILVDRGITLGLDLQGGMRLALEIDDPQGTMSAEARRDATDQALQIIRTRVDELGVAEPVIQKVGDDRIVVELPGLRDEARAKELIAKTAFLKFQIVRPLEQQEPLFNRLDRAVAAAVPAVSADAGATPAAAADLGGLFDAAPDTSAAASAVDSVGAAEATAKPFSSKVFATGEGRFAVAAEDVDAVTRYLALPEVQRIVPRGAEFRWGFVPQQVQAQGPQPRELYLLEQREIMTGQSLQDAQAQRDPQLGQPEVTFELSRRAGRRFEKVTSENVGNQLAIVLDEKVYSAPVIQSAIGSQGRITLGGASIEEARDLALVLRAGALPAPIRIIEERTIGPSLGADSIAKGEIAGIIGIVLVIVVMLLYYRAAGAMAIAALTLYVLFVLGGLSLIDAALTLPGMAGIVLSIGMAVDANVLIFERIREELAAGRSPRIAVSDGFANALSAIVDSNITTLITALILFQFGTGPVRGFAVTLGIGIIASMFTAIFVTRTFFMLYLDRRPAAQPLSI